MRSSLGFGLLGLALPLVAACHGDTGTTGDDTTSPDAAVVDPPKRGFQVVSPEITIPAGKEITYCYYFKTPNTEDLVIKRWVSKMSPGSHHMIMFTTATETKPAGTISDTACGVTGSGTNFPAWIFAAQTEDSELALPTDDGAGKPLGQEIKAGTPAYLQMHYLNSTDADMKVHVTINAEAYDAGAAYTATAPYITFNNSINISENLTKDPTILETATQTCATPPGTKFWLLSTHAHKQAVKTEIKNGMATSTNVAFTSTDWEHPGVKEFMQTPFYTFSGDKLTYSCTYNNIGSNYDRPIRTGDSAQFDEMCMATGYYFPAPRSRICVNNFLLP